MQLIKIGELLNIKVDNQEKQLRPAIIKHNKQFYFLFIYDMLFTTNSCYRRFVAELEILQHDTPYHTFFIMYEPTFHYTYGTSAVANFGRTTLVHISNEDNSIAVPAERIRCTLKKAKQLYLKTYILYRGHNEDT